MLATKRGEKNAALQTTSSRKSTTDRDDKLSKNAEIGTEDRVITTRLSTVPCVIVRTVRLLQFFVISIQIFFFYQTEHL